MGFLNFYLSVGKSKKMVLRKNLAIFEKRGKQKPVLKTRLGLSKNHAWFYSGSR
jgi:hypothetical protein